MILLKENNIRGGISSVKGDRYVESDDNTKIMYIDANNVYGHSPPLPYDENSIDKNVKLKDIKILQVIVIWDISLKLI